jgi:hypothetical protein
MADSRLEPLVLAEGERLTLENWVRRRSTTQGLALRARIVLACAQGGSNIAVAARLGIDRKTVAWPGVEAVETVELREADGVTKLTHRLAFRDQAGRNHMTGTDGLEANYDNVEDLLRSLLDPTA